MKKYKIELSEQQMRLIANCLEDLSRFASGQSEMRYTIEEMLIGLPFDEQIKKRDEVEELLMGNFLYTLLPAGAVYYHKT